VENGGRGREKKEGSVQGEELVKLEILWVDDGMLSLCTVWCVGGSRTR
jgi:hypothetical protein